ncbi:hypothetical protein AAG570_012648 [Ranatra chinensis]|uniref:Uncharacterized protein n=1 Tax=Ranatra chinensis TaxID=642074 RepID=A0ABD0Z2R4_9HEMI
MARIHTVYPVTVSTSINSTPGFSIDVNVAIQMLMMQTLKIPEFDEEPGTLAFVERETLAVYDFAFIHTKGKEIVADCLSRQTNAVEDVGEEYANRFLSGWLGEEDKQSETDSEDPWGFEPLPGNEQTRADGELIIEDTMISDVELKGSEAVARATLAYNESVHSTTGRTQMELMRAWKRRATDKEMKERGKKTVVMLVHSLVAVEVQMGPISAGIVVGGGSEKWWQPVAVSWPKVVDHHLASSSLSKVLYYRSVRGRDLEKKPNGFQAPLSSCWRTALTPTRSASMFVCPRRVAFLRTSLQVVNDKDVFGVHDRSVQLFYGGGLMEVHDGFDFPCGWGDSRCDDPVTKKGNLSSSGLLEVMSRLSMYGKTYKRKAYQKVYDLYKERNVQFFSFAFKDDHLKRFVLHDLPATFTPELILAELKRTIPSITSVSQMTKKLENGSTRKLPLFIVTAKKDVTIQSFSQVRAIFYHEYKVEKFRSGGSNVVQCYKCQNFGHTNRFCNMPERCVCCGQAHSAKECKETILKCPNCSENHSAGSLNCRVRHLYIQRNVSRKSPKKVERVPAATVPPITINKRAPAKKVTGGLSFSEVLGGTDKSTRPAQTHLKPHTKLYTRYITVRNDRVGRNGGGVAILLKESIPFRQIDLPTDPDGTETLGIKVILNNRSTTIINVYNPPNLVLKECLLRNLFDYRGTVIVAGDFNTRHRLWHCIRKNANGAILYDFVMNRGATLFAPETPTYVPSHGKGSQSTLDLVLANSSKCISSISTLTEGGSDYLPVYFELWGTPQTQLKKPRFDFRRTDWDVFRCALNNVIPTARPPLGTATDIDTAVVTFTEEITAAVQASTTTSTPKPQKLELPEEILDLIRDKNKVRRLWQVHRRVEDKRAYYRLHKEVRSRISQWRSNKWDELLRNVSPQDNSLWKLTRRLSRQGSWTTPTLRTETTTATTDLEKAELLAQHFAAINNNSVNRGDGSFNEKVEAEVRRLITGRTNSQTQDASEVGPHTISPSKHATPRLSGAQPEGDSTNPTVPRLRPTLYTHADASGVALGAVLSQAENGEDRPIAYASNKLTDSKTLQSIDRERERATGHSVGGAAVSTIPMAETFQHKDGS